MTPRIDAVLDAARASGADAALLTAQPHLRWAAGFTGSSGALVVGPAGPHFVTDGRYDTQAREEVAGAEVHVPGYRMLEHIAGAGLLGNARRVAVAAGRVTVGEFGHMGEVFSAVEVVAVKGFLDGLLAVKSDDEIRRLRAAQELTCEVLESILPVVKAGARESDVAAELVYQHLKRGAERMSFEPVVASGPRGALPHANVSDRELRRGDMVVIDVGGVLDGYSADLTRMVCIGPPADFQREIFDLVVRAQEAGKSALRAGVLASDADSAARAVIEEAGYGEAFMHSLGHGIGLETHEWPRLSRYAEDKVPARAAVTVEPGVYLAGQFGVRVEDVVVVGSDGVETLTPMSPDLIIA